MEVLKEAARLRASDIYIVAGRPLTYKVQGKLVMPDGAKLCPEVTESMIRAIYLAGNRDLSDFLQIGDDDFSFALTGVSRFRVSVYKQRGSMAAVIRVVGFDLPDPAALGIPGAVMKLADLTKGLILFTGPAGSGKTTTLACLIDRINHSRDNHVITLEDPLEHLHTHDRSIVSQREISTDAGSFAGALRAALRQSPDVILLGSMPDTETISLALSAAESGHLVISSLYTIGAASTIDRLIDSFPPNQHHQIRLQLSMVLQAVVSQQLLPTVDGGIATAFEIMTMNSTVRGMIREAQILALDGVIRASTDEGMITMDQSILSLYHNHVIDQKTAALYSTDPDEWE
jgi:twitching motility protein PilT